MVSCPIDEKVTSNCLPVTKITRKTAKKMLPPSYHPVERPCKDQKYNTLRGENKKG